jgi:hypothetical protein
VSSPKIIDRIRKLLAVASNSGASPQEVETAAKLAHEMMLEHKLSELDVGEAATTDGSAIVDLPAGKEGFMATWRFALVTNVARAFFCEAIGLRVGRSRKVRIIGRRDDAQVVLEVTAFLVKEIERLTEDYARLPEEIFLIETISEGTSAADRKKAYRAGLAFGVSSTLEEQASRWRASSERALVAYRKSREEISQYHENKFGQPRKVEADASTEVRLTAFEHGYERGRQIEIASAKEGKP